MVVLHRRKKSITLSSCVPDINMAVAYFAVRSYLHREVGDSKTSCAALSMRECDCWILSPTY